MLISSEDPYTKSTYPVWMKLGYWFKRYHPETTCPALDQSGASIQPKVCLAWPYANQFWKLIYWSYIPSLNKIGILVQEIMSGNHKQSDQNPLDQSGARIQPKVGQAWPYANQFWRPIYWIYIPSLNEIGVLVQEIMRRNLKCDGRTHGRTDARTDGRTHGHNAF